jgi:tyrosyl-tRNA synthetase
MTVSRLLQMTGLTSSRGEAYRVIRAGGAYLNNRKVTPPDELVFGSDLLHGKYLILRKGKRNAAAVELTD